MGDESKQASDLEAANVVFHDAYAATRDGVRHEVPILVVLGDELALHLRGQRHGFSYSRRAFDSAKSAAHIAVALFALSCDEAFGTATRRRLDQLLEHARGAAAGFERGADPSLAAEVLPLLRACLRFGEDLSLEPASCTAQRERFARETGPSILRVTDLATREQIAALHGAVDVAFQKLSPRERETLQVVVVGDHQARTRSLGMQYFQRRFAEPEGSEDRVMYGEHIADEAEALALVGTKQLDQKIALAFFGDPKRLQRDVLGDSAKACLDRMSFDAEPRRHDSSAKR